MSAEQPAPPTLTEVESEFEELAVDAPLVGIVMGSKSDMAEMEKAGDELADRGIHYEIRVMSAHRDPEVVAEFVRAHVVRGFADDRRRPRRG